MRVIAGPVIRQVYLNAAEMGCRIISANGVDVTNALIAQKASIEAAYDAWAAGTEADRG